MTVLKPYEHVPLTSLKNRFDSWKNVLSNSEMGNVYFLPHEDIHYRAYQFRDWCEADRFPVSLFDLEADLLHDEGKFKETLNLATKPVVLIARSFFFTNPDASRFFSILANARLANSHGILIIHEGFPSLLSSTLAALPAALHQHEIIYPFYDKETLVGFLIAMAKDWSLQTKPEVFEEIWQMCGGNIWLATDVLRGLRDDSKTSINEHVSTELFLRKAQLFWEGLPENHRAVLVYGKTSADYEGTVNELNAFGFSLTEDSQPVYLRRLILNEKLNTFAIKNGHAYYNKVDISREFSNAERRILVNLSTNEGTPVSRESLGESFWQEQKSAEYTDWALDKIMSRIRVKINRLHLPVTIATQRGKGYVYRRSG
ncbi:winged helix-turn-helix domain-containing protein [Candidatus Gottesmanbacteria bacterium]|nr:winged helix-turn-helix domain-containing protein [Candidatus Gottesmanbacteria bacterium]